MTPSVLFVPWVIHGSYDFFLFLGPNIHNGANVLVFLLAFAFYIFGLCYLRYLSLSVWKQDSVCGEGRTINIHQKILDPEVAPHPFPSHPCFLVRLLSLVKLGFTNGDILQIMFVLVALFVNVVVGHRNIRPLPTQQILGKHISRSNLLPNKIRNICHSNSKALLPQMRSMYTLKFFVDLFCTCSSITKPLFIFFVRKPIFGMIYCLAR